MWFPGIKKGYYRFAKIVKVYPDKEGLVRTVRIAYRKTNTQEPRDVCRSDNLVEEEVAVQQLQLLVSVGESCEVGNGLQSEEDNKESLEVENVTGPRYGSGVPLRVSLQVDDAGYDKIVELR